MKKVIVSIFTFIIFTMQVSANAGMLKQDSITECNGIKYGYHGKDQHYHKATLKNGKWYAEGDIIKLPCEKSIDDVENTVENKELSTNTVDKTIEKDKVVLSKCVDGDTAWFLLNNKKIKVRFLAIDTPESTNKIEPYGKEAAKFTCDKLKEAKTIELEYDKNSDKTDKYGRYLAWIIVDGKNLQKELVKNGYAEVDYIYGNYNYIDELKLLQKEAQKNKLNIWSDYKTDSSKYIYIVVLAILLIFFLLTKKQKKAKRVMKKIKSKL